MSDHWCDPRRYQTVVFCVVIVCCSFVLPGWAEEQPTLLRLRLVPSEAGLTGVDAVQQFVAMGEYSDGRQRDVSQLAEFISDNAALARVDKIGRVTAVGEGQTSLRLEFAGHRAAAQVRILAVSPAGSFSFARDVERLLTRHACNTSECHGGVKGKGGFKLSLNGIRPQEDYNWIIRGGVYQVLTDEVGLPRVPRVDLQRPEQSLLLLKPTMSVDHDGGQRFAVDSPDHDTLRNWIRRGAGFGTWDNSTQPIRREVDPVQAVLDEGGRRQILVTAHQANGHREDLTHQVSYISSDPAVIRVNNRGVVSGVAPGEAFVTVRAPGYTGISRFGVTSGPVKHELAVPHENLIDRHVYAKLDKLDVSPAELSSDNEFLRRVCLSLTGTLPPPRRVREFISSSDPEKREKLIDTLLTTPEYIDYWTFRLGQLFRVRGNSHPEHGYAYWHWLRDGITKNRPYDQLARERIAGQGFQGPSRHYPTDDFHPGELMAEQVRVFWGRRLECAQCHDHPFEDWTQQQFWGLAAFFGRMSRTDWAGFAATIIFDDPDGPDPDYERRRTE